MTLIAETHEVRIYQHDTVGGRINVYHSKNGELTFGAESAAVLNRFQKTQAYEAICRVLTHEI